MGGEGVPDYLEIQTTGGKVRGMDSIQNISVKNNP
jgi:hypothetical protein